MLFALAPLAFAEPDVRPEPEPTELDALREEMRAFREVLEAEREENARLRDELRATQTPARPSSKGAVGDVVVVGRGEVVDDVFAFGNDVIVHGRVDGDATALGGNVTISATGRVHGDAVSFGGKVIVEPGGQVLGDRVGVGDPVGVGGFDVSQDTGQRSFWALLYQRLILMLSVAGAGVLIVGLFPNRVDRIASDVERHPLWSVALGTFATLVLTVFSVLFALLTLGLGFPVSALAMIWLGAAWLFGFVGLCQAVGDRLPFANKPTGRWFAFLVGTVLLSCVGSLPWVGWLVVFAASMVSVGATIHSRFGSSAR